MQGRKWQPTPVFFPGESHGWRSLAGYSPRGCKESDTTKGFNFHFSLSLFTVQNSMRYFLSVIPVFLAIIIIIIDEKTEIQRFYLTFHVTLQAAHSKNRLESD